MFQGPPDKLPQHFGYLMLPNFSLMAFSSAIEPLRAANTLSGRELYRWTLLSADMAPVAASNGIAVMPDRAIGDKQHYDAVIAIGGAGTERVKDPRIISYLRRIARMGAYLGAISTAPYVLAHAGLLDHRSCTIHWEYMDGFREDYPHLDVTDELFEIDGPIFTCSGGTAAIDLMLHMISAQHGHDLAAAVSEWFIHKQIREQSEHQRMALRFRVGVSHPKLLAAIEKMEENLEAPVDREEIAEAVGLSTRQLERLFRKYLNATPRKYYFALRMQRARILLRQTTMSVLEPRGQRVLGFLERMRQREKRRDVPFLGAKLDPRRHARLLQRRRQLLAVDRIDGAVGGPVDDETRRIVGADMQGGPPALRPIGDGREDRARDLVFLRIDIDRAGDRDQARAPGRVHPRPVEIVRLQHQRGGRVRAGAVAHGHHALRKPVLGRQFEQPVRGRGGVLGECRVADIGIEPVLDDCDRDAPACEGVADEAIAVLAAAAPGAAVEEQHRRGGDGPLFRQIEVEAHARVIAVGDVGDQAIAVLRHERVERLERRTGRERQPRAHERERCGDQSGQAGAGRSHESVYGLRARPDQPSAAANGSLHAVTSCAADRPGDHLHRLRGAQTMAQIGEQDQQIGLDLRHLVGAMVAQDARDLRQRRRVEDALLLEHDPTALAGMEIREGEAARRRRRPGGGRTAERRGGGGDKTAEGDEDAAAVDGSKELGGVRRKLRGVRIGGIGHAEGPCAL
eukprot:g256.t1